MAKNQDKFNFFVPATFEKGKKGQRTKVKGIASSSTAEDSDGETLFPEGFDVTPLLNKGFLNWDHQSKQRASAIIGEPTVAKIINNGKDLYIEGFLYDSKEAQEVGELAEVLEKNSPTRRLGYSIEGQVIERGSNDKTDPRYKQVLKARITGVAITPCPKNPNTILSLMKGEYNDLYVDDMDLEEGDICPKCGSVWIESGCPKCSVEKAFTAEGSEHVRPESVEGDPTRGKKGTVGHVVRKSEIYNLIAQTYTTDVVKSKAIYSLIETVNLKMFNMQEITMESVNQAFDFLNKAAANDLNKSEGTEITPGEETTVTVTGTEPIVEGEGVILKSEATAKEENNGGEISEFEKACQMAKGLLEGGLSKGEAIDEMVKGGLSLDVSSNAAEKVAAEMSNIKENGGTITPVSAPTVTGDDQPLSKADVAELLAELSSNQDTLIKGLGEQIEGKLEGKFDAVGKILKHTMEQNSLLKGIVDELSTANTEMRQEIKKIGDNAVPTKSATTVGHLDRFAKSEGVASATDGSDSYSIGSKEGRTDLLNRLDAEMEKSRTSGRTPNQLLERTISEIEICKSIPQEAIPMLRALNISITK